MQNYIVRFGTGSVELVLVNMRFSALVDELELAETKGLIPRLLLGKKRTMTVEEFAAFCNEENIVEAGCWNGLYVFAQVDFVWPPIFPS